MKDQFLRNQEIIQSTPLISETDKNYPDIRQPRMETGAKADISTNARRYFVENLGQDMLLIDSGKKSPTADKVPIVDLSLLQRGKFE